MLIQLEEIAAVLVEKGKVGGHDDLFGAKSAMICHSRGADQLPYPRMLIDVQALSNAGDELQRMELCLIGEPDRTGNAKRKR